MRRSLVLGAALILTLSLSACNDDNNTKDDTIHVESVSVASIHELEVGETFTVGTNTVTVLPDNATDKSYSLSSSDKDVFTTSGYVITAVGEGSATLTVTTTDGGFTDWTTITVKGDTETEPGPDQGGDGGDDQPDTGGEGGGGEPDTGGDQPDTDKDVTITTDPTSITVKGGESASFTITVTEGASIQSVVSDNDAVVVTGSGTDWTVTATNNGEGNITATITITAGGTGFNTATKTLPVTVTPADEYTYKMIIDNAANVPTTGWVHNNTDATFTFAPKLETYNRGTLESTTDLSASDVTVSVSNIEETANQIIAVSGLTISPAGKAGTVTVTVEYTGELSVSDTYSYTVTVDETYSYEHTLKIDTTGVPESEKVGDGGFDIVANLITTTTADSWGTTETNTVVAQESDVTISVSPEEAMTVAGLHVVPTANVTEETTVTITVVWSAYSTETTASDSITLTVYPKDSATYTMTITNESEFTGDWYTEDESKTIELSITSSDGDEDPVDVDTLVNEGKITARAITDNVVDIEGLTITPVAKGETTIYVVWTEHTEANASISVTVLEHTYKLSITNKEELSADWSIEDGARTLEIELDSDREDINKTASTNNVEITYEEGAFTPSGDGFTLTPVKTGSYTVTATWVDESLAIGADGVDSFTVNVNDNVKVTDLTLSQTTIEWTAPSSTTITATLTGKDGITPTNQGVTWSISGDSSITVSDEGGLTATVTASAYNASATVTAVSDDNPNAKATCTVNVSAQPAVEAKLTQEAVTPTTVASPDNRGVYVIGTETGSEYITYSNNEFSTTESYDNAAAIRTIPAENTGEYYFAVGEYYIDSSLTATDTEPTTVFSISTNGISLGGSQVYVNSGLSTSGSNAAHLIDMALVESTTKVSSGQYYLYGIHTNYDPAFFNGGTVSTSNKRLTTTSDINSAVKVTIENLGGNEYYMTYGGYYISVDASSAEAIYSTTATKIYYDSTNDVWQDSTSKRYLGTNTSSSNVIFGSYEYTSSGGLNNSYHAVGLYDSDPLPGIKGVGISTEEYSVGINASIHMYGTVYPSCLTAETISWTTSNSSYATVSDGMVTGVSATDSVTITASDGGYSDSVDISVVENIPDYKASETFDFANDDMTVYGWTKSSGSQTALPKTYFDLFTFETGGSGSALSWWDGHIRMYSGNTLTITPTAYEISSIVFSCSSGYGFVSTDTTSNGTLSVSGTSGTTTCTVTPSSKASAIMITNKGDKFGSNTQRRITQMVIYFDETLITNS